MSNTTRQKKIPAFQDVEIIGFHNTRESRDGNEIQDYLDLNSVASNQLVNTSYADEGMIVQNNGNKDDFGRWGEIDDPGSKKEKAASKRESSSKSKIKAGKQK